jgi:hypothetical protein
MTSKITYSTYQLIPTTKIRVNMHHMPILYIQQHNIHDQTCTVRTTRKKSIEKIVRTIRCLSGFQVQATTYAI